jgi:ATP-binding cassette subfamily B protein
MIDRIRTGVKKLKTNLKLKRTVQLVWSVARTWTIVAIILIVLEGLFGLAALYMLKILINTLASPEAKVNGQEPILRYVVLTGVAAILFVIVRVVSGFVTQIQAAKVGEYVDDKIHESAIALDLAFYESPDYFDILKRAKEAGTDRPNAVVVALVDIVKNLFTFLVVGAVLFSIDKYLLPLIALFVLPTLMVSIKFSDRLLAYRIQQTPWERKAAYFSGLILGDATAKEIRGFGLGQYLRKLYYDIRINTLEGRIRIIRRSTINEVFTSVFGAAGLYICIGYICLGTINGRTGVGDITVFLVIFPQAFAAMQAVATSIGKLYQNNIFVTNIFQLFDLKASLVEPENPVSVPAKDKVDLVVENLSFKYPHASKETLTDISFTIPSGKIVALVGLNGAGKTTLIKLLCRLYDPTKGNIKMGDIDIRDFKSADYRKQISAVFQDFGKYNVSVADNIRFGDIDGDRSMEEIADAAKKSGANKYIDSFPKGYDTMMGRIFDEGQEVSIGQWQKLAIARSFYSNSRFVIFDEATSALDAMAEKDFFDTFRDNIGHRGALVISHRISAIKHADYIYVLSGGTIKQSGTHKQLVEMEGDYARLFRSSTPEVD